MDVLHVCLFGTVTVSYNHGTAPLKLAPATQTLLAYLLLQPDRLHPRDVLIDLFWGNQAQDHARACLNTALWRLRNALEPKGTPPGAYLISGPAGEVGFNGRSPVWVDLAVFRQQVQRFLACSPDGLTAADVEALEACLPLYKGDLLEGCYADWALRERERIQLVYLSCLSRLMRYYQQRGSYEKSLELGEKILLLDPLREEIHREMMRLFAACGQRPRAVRQYGLLRDLLDRELGIDPMPETQALYEQIREDGSLIPLTGQPAPAAGVDGLFQEIQQALLMMDQMRERLLRAARLLDQFRGESKDKL